MAIFRYCQPCQTLHSVADWPEGCADPQPARSDLSAPNVMSDIPEYRSPLGTGTISSRSQRREDLARGDCREVAPDEFKPLAPVKPRAKWLKQHGQPAAS